MTSKVEFSSEETDLEQFFDDITDSTNLSTEENITLSDDQKDSYEYKPDVEMGSNLKKIEPGKMIEVEGATWDLAKLNGVYELQEDKHDGKVLYVQPKKHVHIRFHHETEQWFIDTHPLSASNTADAIVAQKVEVPEQITSAWYVPNADCTGWIEDSNIKILSMSAGYQKLFRQCLYSPPKQPEIVVRDPTKSHLDLSRQILSPPPPPPPVVVAAATESVTEETEVVESEEKEPEPPKLTTFQKILPWILYTILALVLIACGFYIGKRFPNENTVTEMEMYKNLVGDYENCKKGKETFEKAIQEERTLTAKGKKGEIDKDSKTKICQAVFHENDDDPEVVIDGVKQTSAQTCPMKLWCLYSSEDTEEGETSKADCIFDECALNEKEAACVNATGCQWSAHTDEEKESLRAQCKTGDDKCYGFEAEKNCKGHEDICVWLEKAIDPEDNMKNGICNEKDICRGIGGIETNTTDVMDGAAMKAKNIEICNKADINSKCEFDPENAKCKYQCSAAIVDKDWHQKKPEQENFQRDDEKSKNYCSENDFKKFCVWSDEGCINKDEDLYTIPEDEDETAENVIADANADADADADLVENLNDI